MSCFAASLALDPNSSTVRAGITAQVGASGNPAKMPSPCYYRVTRLATRGRRLRRIVRWISEHRSSFSSQSAPRALIRSVVLTRAKKTQFGVLAALVLPYYGWFNQVAPPSWIRTELSDGSLGSAFLLTAAWLIWCFLSLPSSRSLLASPDALALRTLPIPKSDWNRVLAPSLLAFQLPVALVVGYGAWLGGPILAIATGASFAAASACVQAIFVTSRPCHRLLAWMVAAVLPWTLLTLSPVAVSVTFAAIGVVGFNFAAHRPAFERYRVVTGKFDLPLPKIWVLARPLISFVRIRLPRRLAAVLGLQLLLALAVYQAHTNAASDLGDALQLGAMCAGAIAGLALIQVARRQGSASGWYLDSLPVSREVAVVARMIPTALLVLFGCLTMFLATALASGRFGGSLASCAISGPAIVLWTGSVSVWMSFRDEIQRRKPRLAGWFAVILLAFVLSLVFESALILLPFAMAHLVAAWRDEPSARNLRRRLELYRQ